MIEAGTRVDNKLADAPETPQMWRNQLLRELASIVHSMGSPDVRKRIERIMRNLDASDQRDKENAP